mgnify:CR=1 FL=1
MHRRNAHRWTVTVGLGLTILAIVTAGCGYAGGDPTSAGAPPEAGTEGVALPDVVVNDVAAGTEVSLRTLAPSDRPILLWFWAPH